MIVTHRIKTLWIILLFSALAACGGGGSGTPGPTQPPTGGPPPTPPSPIDPGMLGDGRLDELVQTIRARHNLPAMGVIVVDDGLVVEQAVDGVRALGSPVAVTVDDKWHLGSVTKAMTATLAAIFVEQSLLTWDTTPVDVWPQYAGTMHPQYRDVTIVQLLAHQAGLQPDVGLIPSLDLTRDDAPGTVIEKRHLWAKELLELNPVDSVGQFHYANAGYIVVGAMLETVTGSSWEELMVNHIFAPLGMSSASFGAPGTPGQLDQPWGHWKQNGSLVSVPPGPGADSQRAVGPAGNVHLTMSDYALFMFAHLEGERGIPGLVSADTYRFLHTPVNGHPYALGWRTNDDVAAANGTLLFHLGTNLRWVASAGLIPGLNSGVLIVTNAGTDDAVDGADEMSDLLGARILASH